MNVKYRIVPALPEHIPYLAEHMREQDVREVWASGRYTPSEALEASLADSVQAWTCILDGQLSRHRTFDRPAFMWGVAHRDGMDADTGVPWLLGTPEIRGLRLAFLRRCLFYVDRMHKSFPFLVNVVHAENDVSIRWLKWCGFTVQDAPTILNDETFHLFWKDEREVAHV